MGMEATPPARSPREAALRARLLKLAEVANQDAALTDRGRFVTLEIQVVIDSCGFFIRLADGRVAGIDEGPHRMRPCAFIVAGAAEAWDKFWTPVPPPWYHDLFAMNKKGVLTIEGNLHPFMANLQYFKDLLALPRRIATG
jgi:hypothetical protein